MPGEPAPEAGPRTEGLFQRPDGAVAEVWRPPGPAYPADVRVRWVSPGAGREALSAMLAEVLVLELDHLAEAAAAGAPFRLAPLREFATRGGWTIETRPPDQPDSYRLKQDGVPGAVEGPRLDLLLALELAVRCALLPFEGQDNPVAWVARARLVYPRLLAALHGEDPLLPA